MQCQGVMMQLVMPGYKGRKNTAYVSGIVKRIKLAGIGSESKKKKWYGLPPKSLNHNQQKTTKLLTRFIWKGKLGDQELYPRQFSHSRETISSQDLQTRPSIR